MIVDRRPGHRRALDATVYRRGRCNNPPMRATEHRIRDPFTLALGRRRHAPAPVVRATGLGLNALEIEDLLIAVGDLEDREGDTARRARLARGRHALELELARALES